MLPPGKYLEVPHKACSQVLRGRVRGGVGNHHGLHVLDLPEPGLVVFQLQLQLFHFQTLPFQLQIVQGGVKAHEKVALFHLVSLGNQDLRNSLGLGEEHGLDPVRGNGAVAFLIVPPEFRHAHIVKGIDRNGITAAPGNTENDPHHDGCRQHHCRKGNDPFLCLTAQLLHGCLLPLSAARRPEYDRSCWRWPRSPARG